MPSGDAEPLPWVAMPACRSGISARRHVDLCTSCGHVRISYNSCRNRHCPKCQQIQRERWIQAREAELLPATYFHVVFTLPEALNKLCLRQPAVVYKLLFDTAWSVMKSFARDQKHLGADTGMIAILHTCLPAVQDFGRRGDRISHFTRIFIALFREVV